MTRTAKSDAVATTRILIVDDHPLVREGLIGLLSAQDDFVICGEASGVAEARRLVAAAKPDVAIIDLTLADGTGIELIKELKAKMPQLKLLVLSMHEESLFAERVMRAGAMGFVSKHEASRTIIQAVRTVLTGKIYLSPNMTELVVQRAFIAGADLSRPPVDRLTDREMEVFELIGQGLSSRQIAVKLEVSPKTVETHREHIKDKLEVSTSTELTRYAVQWVLENQ
ncbi:MAG TPA: response regulator transcription factor [Planctomycetaceae bacterium]|nr:response regulator transcription factor [Planctomycetaceae bacterium]